MAETTSTGTILQGVGGFYTALDGEGREYTLRAQGKLRRERLKPKVGDRVEMGGLLGSAPVMPVHSESAENFVARGGRIPAPIQSLKN